MKFKFKKSKNKIKLTGFKSPQIGDEKTVNKFAYFPTLVDNYLIWFESYYCVYEYCYDMVSFYWQLKFKSRKK